MGILVVVLVAATSAPPTAQLQGLVGAAEEALGPDAIVVVRELASTPSDDDARALETTLHADAVAVIACQDASCDAATLHVATTTTEPFRDRTIGFATADAPGERGRTLGFALASMIPPPAPPPPPPPPPPKPTPPPSTTTKIEDETPPSLETNSSRTHVMLDALSVIASGVGGTFGVEANGRVELGAAFAAGVSFDARFSAVDVATARSTLLMFGPFVAWSPVRAGFFSGGLRLDALAMRQVLARRDTGETRGRWVPAGRASVELAIAFTPSIGLVAFGGPEIALGTTTVVVGDATVTSLPRLRVVGGLGFRGTF
jgi:hypothetical protein